jgi:hypothetical protein
LFIEIFANNIFAINFFMSTFEKLTDGCIFSMIICRDSLTLDDTFLLPFVEGVATNFQLSTIEWRRIKTRGTNTGNISIQWHIFYMFILIQNQFMESFLILLNLILNTEAKRFWCISFNAKTRPLAKINNFLHLIL